MKINTQYRPTANAITVKRMGYLESQAIQFIHNLHFAQQIYRVLFKRGKVVWIGSKDDDITIIDPESGPVMTPLQLRVAKRNVRSFF